VPFVVNIWLILGINRTEKEREGVYIMIKVFKYIYSLIESIIVICFFAIFIIINIQIFCRFGLNHALGWPEEAASILMLWGGYLAVAHVFKENGHVRFNFIVERLPTRIIKIIYLVNSILIGLFLLLVIYFGISISIDVFDIRTSSLRISKLSYYIAIPFSACLMLIFNVQNILNVLQNNKYFEEISKKLKED